MATPRPVFKDVQKIFRTHNQDIPQEIDAAVAAMDRRRIEFEKSQLISQVFSEEPAVVPNLWIKRLGDLFTATVTKGA